MMGPRWSQPPEVHRADTERQFRAPKPCDTCEGDGDVIDLQTHDSDPCPACDGDGVVWTD